MPTIIYKKCPKCKKLLETTDIGCDIGIPFIRCPICQTYCIDRHRGEWDIMSTYRKIELLVYRGMLACIYAVFLPVAVLLLKKIITGSEDVNVVIFLLSYLLGLILSSIYGIKRLKTDILKSRNRLENPEYRGQLMQIGLIR
jgi:uncharacterized membrane protein YqaE (UPF0057 family)